MYQNNVCIVVVDESKPFILQAANVERRTLISIEQQTSDQKPIFYGYRWHRESGVSLQFAAETDKDLSKMLVGPVQIKLDLSEIVLALYIQGGPKK